MGNLFQGITRGVPGMTAQQMAAPASQFARPEKITNNPALQFTPDKLFLGVLNANIKQSNNGEKYAQGGVEIGIKDDRHMITIAGSRAGKGRSSIIPNMLRYQGSVLTIDPKGELALATAKQRAKTQKICVIDPFHTTAGKLPKKFYRGFNPLENMNQASMIEDAALITDALVMQSGKDPHWDDSAKTLIEGVILEVVTTERFAAKKNLATVCSLIAQGDMEAAKELSGGGEEEEEWSGMEALEAHMSQSTEDAVRRAAADFFERPEKERGSVLSTARRHLKAFSFPEIETSLQGESFDLADLKKEVMTVYLCLPGRHIGTCGRWLRLFINLALQAMERTPGQPSAGCPVLFVLDEFAALGHMRSIEDAAGQIAGYGVKLWPILQDLGQLKTLYKDRWETFMGNAGILQFFGNNDLTTLEWVSKRVGSTTIEQLSRSDVTPGARDAAATGESYAPRTTPVMEPDEVSLVFGRSDPQLRQLIIRAGARPMILQRAYYDKHDAFRRPRP
jgi:type IV secretion system protein VirD4